MEKIEEHEEDRREWSMENIWKRANGLESNFTHLKETPKRICSNFTPEQQSVGLLVVNYGLGHE